MPGLATLVTVVAAVAALSVETVESATVGSPAAQRATGGQTGAGEAVLDCEALQTAAQEVVLVAVVGM